MILVCGTYLMATMKRRLLYSPRQLKLIQNDRRPIFLWQMPILELVIMMKRDAFFKKVKKRVEMLKGSLV